MKKYLIILLILTLLVSLAGCDLSSLSEMLDKGFTTAGPKQTEPAVQTETTQPSPVSKSNPYYACYEGYDAYVLPNSDTVYYGRGDIKTLTETERQIAREEIYARHGRSFSDPNLQEYFDARDWYTPGTETKLNDCEKDNLFLLNVFELQQSGEVRSNRYIRHMTDPNNYAMAGSDSRYLKAADLANLEHDHLVVIRNEVYARRGYIFDSDNLKTYFYCTDWYQPNPEFSTKSFNKYESANVYLCDLYERKLEGEKFSSANPYKDYYYGPNSTFLSYSSTERLTEYDVWGINNVELKLARNEILARNGYTFKDKHLLEYFLQCDWYKPNTPPGSKSGMKLSAIEEDNIAFIKSFED